ncbi:ZIP family metal transporter [Mycoplasmopsis gallopavonis]|uniref:ZIP Zinc transporter n=1 Tax=Mycoplasmopsis gallopavonis TaxID=76629 RepID=A0A449AZV1_9BACT|nr:ZIP family metal transporter [Mycoplasmopsis gallopavonis]VEU73027.1 ZIP Zinc transporter [Mycoplasmopsis gallopavonis]
MKWLSLLAGQLNNFTNNENITKMLLVIIFLGALLLIPVGISVLFPLLKSRLNHRTKVYLYAFSTGFFIILSTFGFLREALEQASETGETGMKLYGYNILIVFVGLLSGLIFSFTLKFVITYRINQKLLQNKKLSIFVHDHSHEHNENHVHEHPDHIFSQDDANQLAEEALVEKISGKLKIIALALLLTHRIPEGFLIGYNLSLAMPDLQDLSGGTVGLSNLTTAYFVSLILHMIPEELVFYYRLREAGYGRWNSLLISTLMDMLFLPFMLVGIYGGSSIGGNHFAQGFLMAIIGGIFLFTSLVEFFPEFYHVEMNKKRWFITLLCLFIGVLFSAFILSFHEHSHNHVTTSALIKETIDFSQSSFNQLI